MSERGIPIVMYHGVGPDRAGWPWNHLFTPADVFDLQMRALRDEGWTTVSLSELRAHMASGAPLPAKPVVLTFDDGYADNWVYAYPILKKHGHRAAIWLSTDFVDPRREPRATLEDVWAGRARENSLDPRGYLSWSEMRRMAESGHVEIQSHAMTHTWYPSSGEILDFHRPEGVDDYEAPLWLGWNMFPGRKHESMHVRLFDLVPLGTPIYRHEKSLAARRHYEDERLAEKLRSHVSASGGAAFDLAEPSLPEALLRNPHGGAVAYLGGVRVMDLCLEQQIDTDSFYVPTHRVVFEAMRTLVRQKYFDGLGIIRSQDNFVVQWGIPAEFLRLAWL